MLYLSNTQIHKTKPTWELQIANSNVNKSNVKTDYEYTTWDMKIEICDI